MDSQLVEVNFGDGIDTRTDPRAVITTKLLQAKNVVFTSPGALRTRFGHTQQTFPIGTPVGGSRLFEHNKTPYLINEEAFGTIRDMTGAAHGADLGGLAGLKRQSILRENARVSETDIALSTDGKYILVGACQHWPAAPYLSTHYNVWVLADSTTGEVIKRFAPYSATNSSRPRIAAVGQYFWCLYFATGSGIRAFRIDTTTVAIDIADGVFDANGDGPIDTAPLGGFTDRFLLAYKTVAGHQVGIRDAAMALLAAQPFPSTPSADCIAVSGTAGEMVYLCFRDNATGDLRVRGYTSNGSNLVAAFAAVTLEAAWPTGKVVAICREDSTHARAIWTTSVAGPLYRTNHRDVSSAGALGSTGIGYARQLLTKPWLSPNGITRAFESNIKGGQQIDPIQGAAIVAPLGSAATIYSSFYMDGLCARLIAGFEPNFGLTVPSVITLPNGRMMTTLITKQRQRLNYDYSTVIEQSGVDLVSVDYVSHARYCSAELGGLTYIAGGQLRCFDGRDSFEVGFSAQPQSPVLLADNIGGGTINPGTHQYVAVWEWTDAQGNEHRSAPSLAASITITAPNQTLHGQVEPLPFSLRDAVPQPLLSRVRLMIYGTAANAGIFYRQQTPTNVATNDGSDTTLLFTLTNPDNIITTFPALYTDGGALANYAPPSTDVVITHQNRLFVISAEDGSIWYSKEYTPGIAPGFNDALQFRLPTALQPTALASLDDKLVAFTATEAFLVTGAWPDDRGQGLNITINKLASDVGATDWRSVVVGDQGAYFGSKKGIFLLDRSLSLATVGHDVDVWTLFYEIVASYIPPDRDEVRFALSNPALTPRHQELVLNTRNRTEASPRGTWSTFDYTSFSGNSSRDYIDARSVAGISYKLMGLSGVTPVLWKESLMLFTDNATFIPWLIEMANIYPFGGRQAFGRVRTATFLGTTKSPHNWTIETAYDGEATFTESKTLTFGLIFGLAIQEELSYHLVRQKCAGVRFRISIGPGGAPFGESVWMSGMMLEVVPKKGSRGHWLQPEARQ